MTKRQCVQQIIVTIAVTLVVGYVPEFAHAQTDPTSLLVTDLDWSLDGSRIAVGFSRWQGQYQQACGDGSDILLIDATTGQTTNFPRPDTGCSPSTVDFNTTDSQILVASASTFETWNLVTGQMISAVSMESLFQAASWSPDGTEVLATGLSLVQVLNSNLIDGRAGFLLPPSADFSGFIYSAWSPDGQRIASSMDDGRIYVWSASDSQILATFQGHNAPVKRLAWDPVSNSIASGDDSGIIWIWDASTGQPIRQLSGHTGIVYDIAWHPNGEELVSAGADNTVRVWNAASGAMRIVDSSEPFSAVAYSPDGTKLAYAGTYSSLATPIEIVPAPQHRTAHTNSVPNPNSLSHRHPHPRAWLAAKAARVGAVFR